MYSPLGYSTGIPAFSPPPLLRWMTPKYVEMIPIRNCPLAGASSSLIFHELTVDPTKAKFADGNKSRAQQELLLPASRHITIRL
jgi:hypothetical protein